MLDTFTSLLAGCVIFAVLGTMAHQQNVQIKDVVKEGIVVMITPVAKADLVGLITCSRRDQ